MVDDLKSMMEREMWYVSSNLLESQHISFEPLILMLEMSSVEENRG